jgi:cytochrome c oxidase subunit 2
VDARDEYGQQMYPMAATLVDDAAISNVVAYIGTLPSEPAAATVSGDAARGKSLYATCSGCHGTAGEGVWATNAPRLAGMSDWYLARQLDDFRNGTRGAHPKDYSGAQMAQMSGMLADDRARNDVVAYLGGLR